MSEEISFLLHMNGHVGSRDNRCAFDPSAYHESTAMAIQSTLILTTYMHIYGTR